MNRTIHLLGCCLSTALLFAQTPSIAWQRMLGGSAEEQGHWAIPMPDGGLIGVGWTISADGDVSGFHPGNGSDMWAFRLGPDGALAWTRALGGSETEVPYLLIPAQEGGALLIGTTLSDDGDVTGHHGDEDIWVVRLSDAGDLLWQKCLGGSALDRFETSVTSTVLPTVVQTSDGGFALTALVNSNDGDVTGHHEGVDSTDIWVVKLSSAGDLLWQRCLGGGAKESSPLIMETETGTLMVAGMTRSNDGDVTGNHGLTDLWLVHLDADGELLWQRTLGGTGFETLGWATMTAQGDVLLAATTTSQNGDVSDPLGPLNTSDAWLVRVSMGGELLWERTVGGSGFEQAHAVSERWDGRLLLYMRSWSTDGDMSEGPAYATIWVVCLEVLGPIMWATGLGPGGASGLFQERPVFTADGGCVLAMSLVGDGGDAVDAYGAGDMWLVRLAPDGEVHWQRLCGGSANDHINHILELSDDRIAGIGDSYSIDHDLVGAPSGSAFIWVLVLDGLSTPVEDEGSARPIIAMHHGSGQIEVTWPRNEERTFISLFDMQGRELGSPMQFSGRTTIDLSGQATGAVVLELRSENAVHRSVLLTR